MYRAEFTSAVARQLRKLPREPRARVLELASDPRPPGAIKLSGETAAWRTRIGDNRVIYDILDEVLLVTAVAVGHRRALRDRHGHSLTPAASLVTVMTTRGANPSGNPAWVSLCDSRPHLLDHVERE